MQTALRNPALKASNANTNEEDESAESLTEAKVEAEGMHLVRASTRFEIRLKPRHDDDTPHTQNLETLRALDEASQLVARARNRVARWLYRRDSEWLDALPTPWPKKIEWAPAPIGPKRDGSTGALALTTLAYRYANASSDVARLSSDIVAWASKDVVSKWAAKRYDVLVRQSEGLLHYKPHQPVAIPHKAVKFTLREDGSADIAFRVLSTKVEGVKAITVHIVPRDSWQREELRALASGEWKLGQFVISRHHEKRGRWFIRFSYTKLMPWTPGKEVVAVRRGMKSFIVTASTSGDVRSLVDGGDILAFKRQMLARRRSIGRRARAWQTGSGATGHGVKRRVGALISLSDKEQRWVKERCKQIAAAVVHWAGEQKASEVIIEDFSIPWKEDAWREVKSWPWFATKDAIKTAVENAGLHFRELSVVSNRRRCPMCKFVHDVEPTDSYGRWQCVSCGVTRSVESIVVLNMLGDVGRPEAIERAEKKRRGAMKAVSDASANVANVANVASVASKIPGALASKVDKDSASAKGRRRTKPKTT
jgi:hypothetical protein